MIIVMGVPGAGKSTVIAGLKLGTYKLLNYGTVMFEAAQQMGVAKDRDGMRKLNPTLQKQIQRKAADIIKKHGNKVILDTHCSVKTPLGYLPGLPQSTLKKFNVSHLVYITVHPEELIERRNSDPTRKRDNDSVEQVKEHNDINIALLASYAAFTGATITIIYNRTGKLDEAVAKLQALLE